MATHGIHVILTRSYAQVANQDCGTSQERQGKMDTSNIYVEHNAKCFDGLVLKQEDDAVVVSGWVRENGQWSFRQLTDEEWSAIRHLVKERNATQ